jgi:hypothetical protein
MNSILKSVITADIVVLFNFSAIAEDMLSLPSALNASQEEAEIFATLKQEVEEMKKMKPEQLAEEQVLLHQTVKQMTPEQRLAKRKGILEELNQMSLAERRALNDQPLSEAEKFAAQERIEHSVKSVQ